MEARKDQYEAYVKSVTPVHSTWKNVLMAGISGGLRHSCSVCLICDSRLVTKAVIPLSKRPSLWFLFFYIQVERP